MAVAKPLIPTSTLLLPLFPNLHSSSFSNLQTSIRTSDDKAESKACSEAPYRSFCATHPNGDSSDKATATTLSCNPHTFVNSQDRHVKVMILFLTGIFSLPMVCIVNAIRQVRLQRGEVVTPPAVHADIEDGECR